MSSGTNKQRLNQNNAKIQQIIATLDNKVLTGSLARIVTAELPNTIIKLYDSNSTLLDTKTTDATTGGKVSFNVDSADTYTITAFDSNNVQLWTNTVVVTSDNLEYIVKSGKALGNYSFADWHTALQGGYFSVMFSLRDTFTYSQTGNILDNHKFFIEDITKSGSSEIVHFRMADKYSGGSYNMADDISWITSATATSWSSGTRNYGGYKYSTMRHIMMKQGDAVYSLASSILPDNYSGTLTNGIKFSDLKYTNGNSCPIYDYSSSSDTMSLLSSPLMSAPSNTHVMLMKGYFKIVGIDAATFNAGVYYIRTNGALTKATTYNAGSTYYGLYETIQEDGFYAGALANSNFASYLVRFTSYASTGGTQTNTVSSYSDYCDIPAIEEITGLNVNDTLMSGVPASNVGATNLAGEGSMKPSYDFSVQAIGSGYWSRSAHSNNNIGYCYIYQTGYIGNTSGSSLQGIRLGFCLG